MPRETRRGCAPWRAASRASAWTFLSVRSRSNTTGGSLHDGHFETLRVDWSVVGFRFAVFMPLGSIARPVTINKLRCIRTATRTPPLCYSFPLHGDTPSESTSGRARIRVALLPELRGRSH